MIYKITSHHLLYYYLIWCWCAWINTYSLIFDNAQCFLNFTYIIPINHKKLNLFLIQKHKVEPELPILKWEPFKMTNGSNINHNHWFRFLHLQKPLIIHSNSNLKPDERRYVGRYCNSWSILWKLIVSFWTSYHTHTHTHAHTHTHH